MLQATPTRAPLLLGAVVAAVLAAGPAATAAAFTLQRTADGHPDWTGVWDSTQGMAFDPATADPPGNNAQGEHDRIHPPYNAEWEAKYAATLAEHAKGRIADPINLCVPHGFPRALGGSHGPIQIVATPSMFQMQWEWQSEIHRVNMNRPHLSPEDLWPTFMGDSVGHWEGDTLVIDTIGSKAGQYDRTGAPHSDQTHTVERVRQIDADTLEDRITIEDPVALTRPWVVVRRFTRAKADVRVHDDFCENERNPIVNGEATVILGSELEARRGR